MKTHIKTIATFISASLFFVPNAISGTDKQKFSELDLNNNEKIEINEFRDCLTSATYNNWDTDGDGSLSYDEFYNAQFALLDTNNDGKVQNAEWKAVKSFNTLLNTEAKKEKYAECDPEFKKDKAHMHKKDKKDMASMHEKDKMKKHAKMHDKYDHVYMSWDANNDNILQKDEFISAVEENNLYVAYDVDNNGMITETEMTQVAFNIWDDNNNGFIERSEFAGYGKVCDDDRLSQL